MALNPFFLNGSTTEQGLLQDLINEQLRMYGVEVYYMPRQYITTDINEVIQSEFNNAYPLEAYVNTYDGFGGQQTLLTKFGIEEKDDLTLTISRERFENYITPLIENLSDVELSTRPKEGDLIYFPLGERLFEIKYVEHEQPFYQLKKNYVYELRCELFRYEDEVIDTGVDTIDEEIEQIGYIQTLTLIGSGRTATATAGICTTGAVNRIYISNMGGSYENQPLIGFSSAPAGGTTAVGVASITNVYTNCNGEYGGKIEAINLSNAGCGYTEPPWITIQGGGGTGAAATAGIADGVVQVVTITDGGAGYSTNPVVTISTPQSDNPSLDSGSITMDSTEFTMDNQEEANEQTAVLWSQINSAGVVTAIYISNGGIGYQDAPTITIAGPTGFGTGIGEGSFIFNEVVTGGTSGTTARVKQWTLATYELEVSIVDGDFIPGEVITGNDSGAKYVLSVQNKDDLVTPFADNDNIEARADLILDFSETNPFGMP